MILGIWLVPVIPIVLYETKVSQFSNPGQEFFLLLIYAGYGNKNPGNPAGADGKLANRIARIPIHELAIVPLLVLIGVAATLTSIGMWGFTSQY